jgi:hypothetical protein
MIYLMNVADVQKTGHFLGMAVVRSMGGGTITGGNWEALKVPK